MKKPTHDEVKHLLNEIIVPFYAIERDMMLTKEVVGRQRNENDAEHSWSLAMLACSLAPHIDSKLDNGLICQFAIVHDLVEIYAGDTSVWAEEAALVSKEDNEAAALAKIQTRFAHFPWLVETLEQYERQDSDEALYVRAMDKYIALCVRLMDAGEYYRTRHITKELFESGLVSHRKKAHAHSGVAEYYEKIRAEFDEHPEYFHAESVAKKPDIHKAGGVIIRDRRLLVERSQGKEFFIAPGGSIEPGETPKQALVRELMEEFRLEVQERDLEEFGSFQAQAAGQEDKLVQMDIFMVKKWTGEPTPDNEVEEIKWITSDPQGIKVGSIFEHEVLPRLKAMDLID